MARRVFFSFHYAPDNWRASQIRNIGAIEGNPPASDNDWEAVTRGGDAAIQKWIDNQMSGRTCVIVLIGAATADRKWIDYEIRKAWNDKRGLFGINIHNLLDRNGNKTLKGNNPFAGFTLNKGEVRMDSLVSTYDPPFSDSKTVYKHISDNMESWISRAIADRQ